VDVSNTAPTGDADGKGTIGTIGDFSYEEWNKTGTGKATFYSDGSFSCSFDNIDDYLCRSGILYGENSGVNFKSIGNLYADFSLGNYTNKSGVSYAYIGVYGWTQSPLIEWYIVDSWGSQGRPTWCGTLVKTVTIDGAEYDIYKDDITQARGTIEGTKTFTQYWSIRKTARKCGTINITAHFNAWESAGLKMGSSLYEAKVLGEAGQYPEEHNANGSFDFNYAKVYVGEGSTTPTSSASINPTSSSATTQVVASGALPGTLEFENYESKHSDSLKVYGDVIGSIQPGDWVEWTVDVSYTGTYTFDILAARGDDQGRESTISLSMDDGTSVGSVSVLTDGWDDYDTFSGVTSSISAGQHKLRVTFTSGYVNVDNIQFTAKEVDMSSMYEPPSSSSSPINGSSASINPNPTSSNSVNNGSSASVGPNPTSSSPVNNGPSTNDSGSSNGGDIVDNNGQDVTSIGDIRLPISSGDMLVFDVQGRNLGLVRVAAGTSLEDALFAKFHRSGIYLVKQGSRMMKVRVNR
jgi:endo-1,4-beta-xylanase